jgi:hypothetical protein
MTYVSCVVVGGVSASASFTGSVAAEFGQETRKTITSSTSSRGKITQGYGCSDAYPYMWSSSMVASSTFPSPWETQEDIINRNRIMCLAKPSRPLCPYGTCADLIGRNADDCRKCCCNSQGQFVECNTKEWRDFSRICSK